MSSLSPSILWTQINRSSFTQTLTRPSTILSAELTQSPLTDIENYLASTGLNVCYDKMIIFNDSIFDEELSLKNELRMIRSLINEDHVTLNHMISSSIAKLKSFRLLSKEILDFNQKSFRSDNHYRKTLSKYLDESYRVMPYLSFANSLCLAVIEELRNITIDSFNDTELGELLTSKSSSDLFNTNNIHVKMIESIQDPSKFTTVEKLIQKYRLSTFDWNNTNKYSVRELLNYIEQPSPTPNVKDVKKQNAPEIDKRLGKFRTNEKFNTLIKMGKQSNWFKTYRSMIINESQARLHKFLLNNFRLRSLPLYTIPHLTINELIDLHLPNAEYVEQRSKSFCIVFLNGEKYLIEGKDAITLHNSFQLHSSSNLSGAVVTKFSQKEIEGVARVIHSVQELQSFKAGEIFISHNTIPAYCPAIFKAKAVVVDEGGHLSHASIICREFNIPCIVGTKSATKTIRSGQKVVLNMENGTVTPLPDPL